MPYALKTVVVALLLTALCLALPTANPGGDAWYYAACARWGQELWQPHHLLYNAVGWGWLHLLGSPVAAMRWLQALNALAYGGCLLALAWLLRLAGARPAAVPAWVLLVGSCFGMLRFAVENEAYIQPLLLALLASGCWARALAATGPPAIRRLVLAGLLAALACLLHQLLAWWWLGLLLGLQPWRSAAARRVVAYAAPALLVPVAYWLAAPESGVAGTLRFALHDYLTGGARVELGARSLLLTPISLVRTLLQVHGNLLPLLHRWPWPLGAVAVGCLGLGVWAVLGRKTPPGPPPAGAPALAGPAAIVARVHLRIAALQLLFATLAAGNAEFMALLPALAAVGLAGGQLRRWPARQVAALGAALLGWNIAFGLLPAHTLTYTDAGPALQRLVQQQPQAWLLLLDPNPLRNQLHYLTGQPVAPPRVLGLAGQDSTRFRQWLRQRLAAGDTVYTDALAAPRPFDRARLVLGDPAARLLGGFAVRRVAALPTFFGPYYLSVLLPAARTHPAALPDSASAATNTGAAR